MIKSILTHYLWDVALNTFFDNVTKNFTLYESSIILDANIQNLISKWSPVINSDIGNTVQKEHIGLLAICIEEQKNHNVNVCNDGIPELQNYSMALIRKLFGEAYNWKISGEYNPTCRVIRMPVNKLLVDMSIPSYGCMILEKFYIECLRILSMATMNGMLISTTKTHIELYI